MNKLLIIFLVMIVGSLVAWQGAINAQLGKMLSHPLQAAFISFLGGTLALAAALLIMQIGFPSFHAVKGIPPYLLIGGLLGAIFVTSVILFVPKIGVANVLIAAVAGQLILSLIIDNYGLLGVPKQPIAASRIAGTLLVIAGLYLVNKK
ncbi:DMT family transporter [Prolixibacter bellariivorans]|nr:DMT family transporter [Prolixibacter bellariivorans]